MTALSYGQVFKGKFVFENAHALEAGIDRFLAIDDSIADLDSLKVDGTTVAIDIDCSAPASRYESTMVAIAELGAHAPSGGVNAEFHLDGISRERVGHGGSQAGRDLPPQHRRWEVFFAAKTGDAQKLGALAEAGISLDQTYAQYRGWNTLHLAAAAGSADAVKLLLDAGIAPNVSNSPTGDTPLSLAGTAAVVQVLLAAGADRDRPVDDSVALGSACGSREEVALALIEAGAKIPAAACEDAVKLCAVHGKVEVLRALVKSDPDIVTAFAAPSVMEYAIRGGSSVLVDFLLEHGAKLPDSFLVDAVRANSPELLESALRASDALARCGPSSGREDAMVVAASQGYLDVMKILARAGVPIHPAEPGDLFPLKAAAGSYGKTALDCVKWLVAQGAPVDGATMHGSNAVRSALNAFNGDIALYLAQQGADPAPIRAIERDEIEQMQREIGAKTWKALLAIANVPTKPAAKKPAAKKPAAKKPAAKTAPKKSK